MASSKEQLAALFKQLADEENKALVSELVAMRKKNDGHRKKIAEDQATIAAISSSIEKMRAEKEAIAVATKANELDRDTSNKRMRISKERVNTIMQLTAQYHNGI